MAFGILLYDQDRRVMAIDDAAALILGKPSHELLGRNLYDFIPPPDRKALAEARATFERLGEASGQYALQHDDGSQESIVYAVLGNAPMPGLNLMTIAHSDAAIPSDESRVRRIGNDVYTGLELSEDDRQIATGTLRLRGAPGPAPTIQAGTVAAAVFRTEGEGLAALLAIQTRIVKLEMGLSSFGSGWPVDERSLLAVRGIADHREDVATIVEEFGGTLIASLEG